MSNKDMMRLVATMLADRTPVPEIEKLSAENTMATATL